MPTMPIDSAIGMRTNASSSIASRPTSASVIASGGRLGGARRAGHEPNVQVDESGQRDHPGHEIDERADQHLDDVGGVAVGGDAARLDPDLPGVNAIDRGFLEDH